MVNTATCELLTVDAARELGGRFVAGLRASGQPERSRFHFQAGNSGSLLAAVLGCLLRCYVPVVISDKLTAGGGRTHFRC